MQFAAYALGSAGACLLVKETGGGSSRSSPTASPSAALSSTNVSGAAEQAGRFDRRAFAAMTMCYIAWNVLQRSLFAKGVSAVEWLVLDKLVGSWWMLLFLAIASIPAPNRSFLSDLGASLRTGWNAKWTMLTFLSLQFCRISLGFIFVGPKSIGLATATLLSVLSRMVASNIITHLAFAACPPPSGSCSQAKRILASSKRCRFSHRTVGNVCLTVAMLLAASGAADNGGAVDRTAAGELYTRKALQHPQRHQPPDSTGTPVRISGEAMSSAFLVGDFGCTSSMSVKGCSQTPRAQQEVAAGMHREMLRSAPPSFVVNLGDAAYDAGVSNVDEAAQVEAHHQRVYQPATKLRGIPWYGVVGNHDYLGNTELLRQGAKSLGLDPFHTGRLYYDWTHPVVGGNGGVAHFIVLDTSYAQSDAICRSKYQRHASKLADARSPVVAACRNDFAELWTTQLKWLEQVLATGRQEPLSQTPDEASPPRVLWTVVFGHNPIVATGKWAFYKSNATALHADLLPVLKAGSADAYICAHDHLLQLLSSEDGMLFGVFGGGGADLEDEPRVSVPYPGINVEHTAQSHGFGTIDFSHTVDGDTLCLSAHPVTVTNDSSTLNADTVVRKVCSRRVSTATLSSTTDTAPPTSLSSTTARQAGLKGPVAVSERPPSLTEHAAASLAAANAAFRKWKSNAGLIVKTLECKCSTLRGYSCGPAAFPRLLGSTAARGTCDKVPLWRVHLC